MRILPYIPIMYYKYRKMTCSFFFLQNFISMICLRSTYFEVDPLESAAKMYISMN